MMGFRALHIILLFALLGSCATVTVPDAGSYRLPGEYNLFFRAHSVKIGDPSRDRRCYYRIFINRVEAGRTSTGLESQYVAFETKLPVNRHVIEVEKWVLSKREGGYVKLNRIDQPKPNFFYFDIPEKRIVVITLKTDAESGKSSFGLEHERD